MQINQEELPDGWEVKSLSEVAEVIMGQSPPSSSYNKTGDGLPFFQGKAEFGELHPVPCKWCNNPTKIAKKKDILLTVRAPVGPTNIAEQDCCIGRGLAAICAKPEILNQEFLYLYFKVIEKELSKQGRGSTFTAVSGAEIRALKIPLPPLPVQQKIVSKLDAFFKEYNEAKKQHELVKARTEKIMQAAISKLIPDPEGELPEGWGVKPLGALAKIKGGKRLPPNSVLLDQKTEHPYLRLTDISGNTIDDRQLKYLDSKTFKKISRYTITSKDVFISIVGTIGVAGVIPVELDGANLTENAAKIFELSQLDNRYLMFFLNSVYAQRQIHQLTVATGVPKLALFRIEQIKIAYPKILVQKEIVRQLDVLIKQLTAVRFNQKKEESYIDLLPTAVLRKAFRGELII